MKFDVTPDALDDVASTLKSQIEGIRPVPSGASLLATPSLLGALEIIDERLRQAADDAVEGITTIADALTAAASLYRKNDRDLATCTTVTP